MVSEEARGRRRIHEHDTGDGRDAPLPTVAVLHPAGALDPDEELGRDVAPEAQVAGEAIHSLVLDVPATLAGDAGRSVAESQRHPEARALPFRGLRIELRGHDDQRRDAPRVHDP